MGYFNMFDEWAMDPKVQSMSEHLQRRHAMLLCLRNIGNTDSMPDEEVATFMRIGLKAARETKTLFKAKGFIDGDGWNVSHWEERQNGHCESYNRVKKHRALKAQNGVSVTHNETLQKRDRNVTEKRHAPEYLLTSELTSVTSEKKKPPKSPKGGEEKPPVPDWINPDTWAGFDEMRTRIKRPMTARAMKIAFGKLAKLRAKGQDANEILEEATLGEWKGIWALHDSQAPTRKTDDPRRDYTPGGMGQRSDVGALAPITPEEQARIDKDNSERAALFEEHKRKVRDERERLKRENKT
jgi:hypothetical protein